MTVWILDVDRPTGGERAGGHTRTMSMSMYMDMDMVRTLDARRRTGESVASATRALAWLDDCRLVAGQTGRSIDPVGASEAHVSDSTVGLRE